MGIVGLRSMSEVPASKYLRNLKRIFFAEISFFKIFNFQKNGDLTVEHLTELNKQKGRKWKTHNRPFCFSTQ